MPASQDNWNMVLSTMALMEYLDGPDSASRFFATLGEVDVALDRVFLPGDFDGNGIVDGDDFLVWQVGFGTTVGATPADGDADGDADVDGDDFLLWQSHFGESLPESTRVVAVPEPQSVLLCVLMVGSAWGCVFVRRAEDPKATRTLGASGSLETDANRIGTRG